LAYHFSLKVFSQILRRSAARTDQFTWAVLKAHTNNTAGTVKLRSTNPRDRNQLTTLTKATIPVEGFTKCRRGQIRQALTEQSDLFVKTEMLPGVAIDEEENLSNSLRTKPGASRLWNL